MNFLKGWFEEEPKTKPVVDGNQDETVETVESKTTHFPESIGQSFAGIFTLNAEPDPKYMERVVSVISEANLPGVDYFEFSEAVGNLLSSSTPQQAITSAFTTFKAVDKDLTVEKLLSSADHYIQEASNLKSDFFEDSNGQLSAEEKKFKSFQDSFNKLLDGLDDDQATNDIMAAVAPLFHQFIERAKQKQTLRQSKMALVVEKVIRKIENDKAGISNYLNSK